MKNLIVLILGLLLITVSANAKFGANVVDNKEYVGEYEFDQLSPIRKIKIEDTGTNLIAKTETGDSSVEPTSKKDTFKLVNFEGTLEFSRDESGAVVGVTLTVQGSSYKGSKKK